MNFDKRNTEGLLDNAWSSVKSALLDKLTRRHDFQDKTSILLSMTTDSENKSDVLAEVIVDKLRQSLKRDLETNPIEEASTPRVSPKSNGNRTSNEGLGSSPHKSKRKPSVKYNGLSEQELSKRHLPDHLVLNLDILIVGLNPSLQSAFKGHHYAGPGHHFWKCIYTSGIVSQSMNACEDYRLPQFGVGFTNVVPKASKSASDLTKDEINDGRIVLIQKIKLYKPKIVVLVGKSVFDIFYTCRQFCYGKQMMKFPESDSYVFVIPSATGCGSSYWPRVQDKLPFFKALRKLRDYVKGQLSILNDEDVIFPVSNLSNGNQHESSSTGSNIPNTNSVSARKAHNEFNNIQMPFIDHTLPIDVRSPSTTDENIDSYNSVTSNMPIKQLNSLQECNNIYHLSPKTENDKPSTVLNSEHNDMISNPLIQQGICMKCSPSMNTVIKQSMEDTAYCPSKLSCIDMPEDNHTEADMSSAYSSMNSNYSGPVVFHHTSTNNSSRCSAASSDSDDTNLRVKQAQQKSLLINQSTSIIADKSSTSGNFQKPLYDMCPDIADSSVDNRLSVCQSYEDDSLTYHTDKVVFEHNFQHQHAYHQPNEGFYYLDNEVAAPVIFEWHHVDIPEHNPHKSYTTQPNIINNDTGEFTKLYFLDDEYSYSAEPIIRQLVPSSKL